MVKPAFAARLCVVSLAAINISCGNVGDSTLAHSASLNDADLPSLLMFCFLGRTRSLVVC